MRSFIYPVIFLLLIAACQETGGDKGLKPDPDEELKSVAQTIAGKFTGNGKRMEGGIKLGVTRGCGLPVGWDSHLKSGDAVMNISALTDSTVQVNIVSAKFPQQNYRLAVKKSGMNIRMGGNLGTYDTNTRFLSFRSGGSIQSDCNVSNYYLYSVCMITNLGTECSHTTTPVTEFSGTREP